jgi:hypothetical protein
MELFKVEQVAKLMGVTPRRVRTLLATSRLTGFKDTNGTWRITYPFQVTAGKRGPDLKHFPVRHLYRKPSAKLER